MLVKNFVLALAMPLAALYITGCSDKESCTSIAYNLGCSSKEGASVDISKDCCSSLHNDDTPLEDRKKGNVTGCDGDDGRAMQAACR
mmetsp:Transcript_104765/g.208168  ORF Transcript_104765/g.208168 Transcript_104765/m.208168 type:complete len:87 (+) Transcript_104765:74-334(+)